MRGRKKSLLISLVFIILAILFVPTNVMAATNNDISIVRVNDNRYIVYVQDLNETFQYGFSDDETMEPTDYDVSSLDSNGNNVAILDTNVFDYVETNSFIWIKSKENEIVTTKKINLKDTLNYQNVVNINNITKRIEVTTDEYQKTISDSESKIKTVTTGKTVITDDSTKDYQYGLFKLPDSDLVNKLVEIVDKIKTFDEATDMYVTTTTYKEFDTLYNELVSNMAWKDVEDMTILQPEDSVNGDRYLLVLRKLDGQTELLNDLQILTCKRDEDKGIDQVIQTHEVEKAVKLPITGDNIILILGFGILIIALIVLFVLKKKSNHTTQE